jgi:hypothetical protein
MTSGSRTTAASPPANLKISWPGGRGRRNSRLLVLFVAVSLWLPFHAQAANNFSAKKITKILPKIVEPAQEIWVGEKLEYNVSWMGVHVGYGTVEVLGKESVAGREAYHVVAIAKTNEVLSAIYPVHDELHSWIDAETLTSLQFEKKASEGFYRAHERVAYDVKKKKGFYESLKNGSKKEFDIEIPVQDVISSFYWVRRQPMTVGKSIKGRVNNGEKDYELLTEVLKHELKEMRGFGEQDLITVEPKTKLEGVLDKRGQVWIQLQNSAKRIPIQITFKTPFGAITGILKKQVLKKEPNAPR